MSSMRQSLASLWPPLPSTLRSSHLVVAAVGSAAALGTIYLVYLKRSVSQHLTDSHGTRVPRPRKHPSPTSGGFPLGTRIPAAIPPEVASEESDHVLSFERIVSKPIPASLLAFPATDLETGPSPLLTTYIRTTMKAFSWTPQAFVLRAMVSDPAKRTFNADAIDAMDFASPHWVTGVYRVAYRGRNQQGTGDQVVLNLEPPEGYRGPVVQGLILASVETCISDSDEPCVVFANETWMWRRSNEKPTLLEGAASRWLHTLIISSMLVKGIRAVSKP